MSRLNDLMNCHIHFNVDVKLSLLAKDQAWKLKFSDYDNLLYINKIFKYGHA